ncbi:hypothetical protein [Corynebacterium mastitidis]
MRRVLSASWPPCGENIIKNPIAAMSGMTSIIGLTVPEERNMTVTMAAMAETITTGIKSLNSDVAAGRCAAGTGSALRVPSGRGGAGTRPPKARYCTHKSGAVVA